MLIRISGSEFYTGVEKVIPNTGRMLVNFKVDGMVLHVQLIGNIITESEIDILEKESGNDLDITVTLTPSILLINKAEDVYLDLLPDILNVRQNRYSLSVTKEWESRVELPEWDDEKAVDFNEKEFKDIVSKTRALDSVAHFIKEPLANLTFFNGYCYCEYSNIILRVKTDIGNFTISAETARNLQKLLDVKCRCIVDKSRGLLYIKTKYKLISAMISPVNLQRVDAKEKRVDDLKFYTDTSFAGKSEDIDALVRVYKAAKVTINMTKDKMGLTVTDGKHTFTYGDRMIPDKSMSFTINHLNALNKLFNAEEGVNVLIGGNLLCWRKERITLLVAGTLY